MQNRASLEQLAEMIGMGTWTAVLNAGGYALPVRFRIRGAAVECRVPTWSGIGDRLTSDDHALLVLVEEGGRELRWRLIGGSAHLVANPDWEGLIPPETQRISPSYLYQVVRIEPRRIELVDEARGWGYRETMDF